MDGMFNLDNLRYKNIYIFFFLVWFFYEEAFEP